jgi:hypothetical protein
MSTYTPDKWVIIRILSDDEEPHYRILAGWSGGHTDGFTWKISSRIERAFDRDNQFEMHQSSGSVYRCDKLNCGFTSFSRFIFECYKNKSVGNKVDIELVEEGFIPMLMTVH